MDDRLQAAQSSEGIVKHMLDDSPLASSLLKKAAADYYGRIEAIRGGIIDIRGQDEMLDLLVAIPPAAKKTVHAVDQTDLERWFDARMYRYLDAQLERAREGKVTLERVRMVRRAHLELPEQRALLREFIRRHEDARARLLLDGTVEVFLGTEQERIKEHVQTHGCSEVILEHLASFDDPPFSLGQVVGRPWDPLSRPM